jgi:rubrerythrin
MYDELEKLSLKEIFGYAIGSEDAANKYYLSLAKSVSQLVAVRFENIARDEAMHKSILLHLHKELFGDENYSYPEGLPPFESSVKIDSVANLIEALNTAMLNEDNAYHVYKYLAKHQKKHKRLFEYLALMERGHYQTLKSEKELYENEVKEDRNVGKMAPHSEDLWRTSVIAKENLY